MSSGLRWSEDQLRAHQQRTPLPQKPNAKFKHIRVTDADGRTHDSKLECSRWQELQQLEAMKVIRDLRPQVPFALNTVTADGSVALVGTYVADAVYTDVRTGKEIVEDSKGSGDTPLFRWKARHFKAQYRKEITIVRKVRK